jgi:hypothetical protein
MTLDRTQMSESVMFLRRSYPLILCFSNGGCLVVRERIRNCFSFQELKFINIDFTSKIVLNVLKCREKLL